MDGDIVTTHPSFGIAKFSRHSCSHPQSLFGSSIGHENTITLTISRADHIRSDSSYDRYYEKGQIIEVEMSAAQFAEMITTMNMVVVCQLRFAEYRELLLRVLIPLINVSNTVMNLNRE